MTAAAKRLANDHNMAQVMRGLESYYNKDTRLYAHYVDGGITDNLGLRAIYEVIEIAGGPRALYRNLGVKPPRYAMLITVNTSTDPEPEMDKRKKQPSVAETINAMSNVQLHRYNNATMALMEKSMQQWAASVSTAKRSVTPYHVQVGFINIASPEKRLFFYSIPTNFALSEEQVDRLILAGRELLRNNPDYQRMLADLGYVQTSAK